MEKRGGQIRVEKTELEAKLPHGNITEQRGMTFVTLEDCTQRAKHRQYLAMVYVC